ncbi:hypothetical protein [Cupriavidus sp. CP313]
MVFFSGDGGIPSFNVRSELVIEHGRPVAWQAGVGLNLAAGLAQIAFAAASRRRPPALAAT